MLCFPLRRGALIGSSALLAASLFYSTTALAQSISVTRSLEVTAVPVPMDNKLILALLLLALAFVGWRQLRRGGRAHRIVAWALVGPLGLGAFGIGGGAQVLANVVNTFTNPAGETLNIPINTVASNGYFTGFAEQEFTNNAGETLRISSIVAPTTAQCFAGGATAASKLLQPASTSTSLATPCSVGLLLQDGDTCSVDVDTLCRGLLGTPPTITSIAPESEMSSGGALVTLTGTGLTGTIAVTFGGVAGNVQTVTDTTLTVMAPAVTGTVDVAVETPAGLVVKPAAYSAHYTVGGSVSGLAGPGATLALVNNGGDPLTITSNGAFTFTTPLVSGSSYTVTVQALPSDQICTVTNSTGVIGTSNISNVELTCAFVQGYVFNGVDGVDDNFEIPLSGLDGYGFNGNVGDNDVMTLTTAGSVVINNGTTGGTLTNIKALHLADGSNHITFANATSGITQVFGSSGHDVVDLTNTGNSFLAGTVNLGTGDNRLMLESKTYTGTFTAGAGSSTLNMPDGTNIAGSHVTGFNNLELASNATVTMLPEQMTQFSTGTSTVTATGNETIRLATAGNIQALPSVENYVLADGANHFTATNSPVTVTGANGNDTFQFTSQQINEYLTSLDAGTGTNVLSIHGTDTQAIDLSTKSISNIATINVTDGTAAADFTNLNGPVVLNYTRSTGNNTIMLGSGGQTLNLLGSSAATTTIVGGTGPDRINLPSTGTSSEILDMTQVSTGSNKTTIKIVSNFNATGNDYFKTGVQATALGSYVMGSANQATFLNSITAGLSGFLSHTGQAFQITISGGSAAGVYLFQNSGSDPSQFDSDDFFIQLTGSIGIYSALNMIP